MSFEQQQEWTGAARPPTVSAFRHLLTEFATEAGIGGTTLDAVRACVSEAVTNSVVHGYRDGRPPGTVRVHAQVLDGELRIIVADDGIGFLPRTDSPGLGLGLPTIVALADSMSVTTPRGGGTEICMTFGVGAA
jgi:anti-sigma regulatory factor (Ser/Thr protein kinase)